MRVLREAEVDGFVAVSECSERNIGVLRQAEVAGFVAV